MLPPGLLDQCLGLVFFQNLAIGYYLAVHHQSWGSHHSVGGNLREVRYMLNRSVIPSSASASRAASSKALHLAHSEPSTLIPEAPLFHLLRGAAAATAAGFCFFFFLAEQSHKSFLLISTKF